MAKSSRDYIPPDGFVSLFTPSRRGRPLRRGEYPGAATPAAEFQPPGTSRAAEMAVHDRLISANIGGNQTSVASRCANQLFRAIDRGRDNVVVDQIARDDHHGKHCDIVRKLFPGRRKNLISLPYIGAVRACG
jgi:hypothetical protein